MEALFKDLYLYELVLLFLGVFLFLILSAGLVYYIIKKEEIKKLLLFFPIPILMIGYPSVKEITISSDKIAFSKYQEEYIENPEDTIAKQNLEKLTEKLEERAHSPEDIIQISKAKLLLGNTKEAVQYANKAIKIEKERVNSGNASETEDPTTNDPANSSQTIRITTQANQLKQLARIQNMKSKDVDTTVLNAKINELKVDKELVGTKKIIKRKAFENLKIKN
ncbi:hypothetical protein [Aquimarina litoralis]|uniref:hypothetical protein n=1 Tax=Aquimarina litoralis TaxID=584605 RepID=UPI001C59DA60|nr:hypothetical protein [Aquimarina litoralis]MBW1297384.1 hypothetical protein [Aquimarina litoralis]